MIRIYKYGEVSNDEIFARAEAKVDVAGIVSDIIANVRQNGDAALREYSEKFASDIDVEVKSIPLRSVLLKSMRHLKLLIPN